MGWDAALPEARPHRAAPMRCGARAWFLARVERAPKLGQCACFSYLFANQEFNERVLLTLCLNPRPVRCSNLRESAKTQSVKAAQARVSALCHMKTSCMRTLSQLFFGEIRRVLGEPVARDALHATFRSLRSGRRCAWCTNAHLY